MNKVLSNFQIDDFFKDEENEDLKKILYGYIFNRFYNKIYKFLRNN